MLYADVILPLPLQGVFTYSLPSDLTNQIHEGSRVVVQFGKKKFYTAIVFKIYNVSVEKEGIKEIITTLEDFPIVSKQQLKFWEWIATYYMCSLGDVYKAALPSALKLESETYIQLNSEFESEEPLKTNEQKIVRLLSATKPIKIAELEKQKDISNVISSIKSLVDKGAVIISENIQNTYITKKQDAVRLGKDYSIQDLNDIIDQLGKAKKQQQLFINFLDLSQKSDLITKKDLLAVGNSTTTVLNELVKKNILEVYPIKVSRFNYGNPNIESAYTLNSDQEKAFEEIKESFETNDITLLHGVTGSGKTEIYIQLIKDSISKGKQVLYLLPEIALTAQITDRLKAVFGNKLIVYHSKFNDNERAETWNRLLTDKDCQIVLGARSAVFLPLPQLDLIIVDEEHESSYKQQDPSPRYNARNAAIVLANMAGAKVLLGTATPSLESYYNALQGRYGLVRLTKRHEGINLPHIEVINIKELRRKKQMKSLLSPPMIEQVGKALLNKEQIILFQNRRGFSSVLECKTCAWTPQCNHCDVSLTYHKGQRMLLCHYCGSAYSVPRLCPDCQTPTLEFLGYGTERIEEEVIAIFPEAAVARMDLDTTRGKRSYEQIIGRLEKKETDILIGTQMVSKGLDFDNVSIVGILNADNLLNYPDFRAHERAFQLLTQVSGRAGRKHKQGLVVLQTSHPSHNVINAVKKNDYNTFYKLQIEERKLFRYPPFYRMIAIILRGKDENILDLAASRFSQSLREAFGDRILGPGKPPIARIQTLHIRKILLKIENKASIQKVRDIIYHHQSQVLSDAAFKSILLHYDVDPM